MKEIKASMAGSIWKIMVQQGETIQAGQEVVILESMKMEIPVHAEAGGVVKELNVDEGSFVDEGETLLTLE